MDLAKTLAMLTAASAVERNDALAALNVAERAQLIDALQRGRTGRDEEQFVRDIFIATTGDALGALKDAIDDGSSYRDLHQLLYRDIDDAAVRAAILAHFRTTAGEAPAAPSFKVLSDIDDTFYANWKDTRYPKKTVYPGVVAFYEALGGGLVFVSARPGDRTGFVENAAIASLRARGIAKCTVLCGSFSHLLGNDRIAAKKYENFVEFRALYPHHRFVFVGDSGQGDIAFGEMLLGDAEASGVQAVFIHDVVATPEARRRELAEKRIHLFDTYTGAAMAAHASGVLDLEGVSRVARATTEELAAVPFATPAQREAREAELDRDLAAVPGARAGRLGG
ncbi:App1 family protein [Pendulispora rubella]|uniref:App1 family protein n=1 Tax=Pendulispora rubella TaxID=2741070 RepID=A0ABZ2LHD9_9BACT